jgi:hypothetical protein
MRSTDGPGNVRATTPRSALLAGLACVFLASMAAVAMASSGDGPHSAISQKALDRLLQHQGSTGSATSADAEVPIPLTPAGAQLAWLLSEVNGGSATLTRAEVRSHVSERFRAALPADRIVRLLRRSTTANGPLELTGISHRSSAVSAVATVTMHAHRKLVISVRVDAGAPHRITALDISDAAQPKGT